MRGENKVLALHFLRCSLLYSPGLISEKPFWSGGDKVAELQHQYKRYLRRVSPDQIPQSFDEFSGLSAECVLTRFERQVASGKVPESINTLGRLRHNGERYNPFTPVEIVDPGVADPDPQKYPINVYLAGMHIREMIQKDGWEATRRMLGKHANGQLKRLLRTYADFLPDGDPAIRIDSDVLFTCYQESFRKQFPKPGSSRVPNPPRLPEGTGLESVDARFLC
jgi:hypothetical protein